MDCHNGIFSGRVERIIGYFGISDRKLGPGSTPEIVINPERHAPACMFVIAGAAARTSIQGQNCYHSS